MILIYIIGFYIVPALTLLAFMNYDVFVKKQSLTYGEYLGLTCAFLIPLVNFVVGLFILSWFISKSALFDRVSNFLDKRIN